LLGPATGGPEWMPQLDQILKAVPAMTEVTYHRYPLSCWAGPGKPTYASIANLLNPRSTVGLAASLSSDVKEADALQRPFRIDEINSSSCGGRKGVSDTFASALWGLNALFAMAQAGVIGVNFHTFPHAAYQLFSFNDSGGTWTGTAAPEYYGLLMFSQAAPAGSQMLSVTSGGSPKLQAWATRGGDTTAQATVTRVTLTNDSTVHPLTVTVDVPPAGNATLARLTAPSAAATGGVQLAGQEIPAGSRSGLLAGQAQTTSVAPNGGSGYTVTLPPASAALLTVG
jgi:hypothetical protein